MNLLDWCPPAVAQNNPYTPACIAQRGRAIDWRDSLRRRGARHASSGGAAPEAFHPVRHRSATKTGALGQGTWDFLALTAPQEACPRADLSAQRGRDAGEDIS